jgi:hypothetical protein
MKKRVLSFAIALLTVFSALTIAPANVSAATTIPSDALEYGGHSYYLYQMSSHITWTDAQIACEEAGGHLVTITSKKENNKIWEYIKSQGNTYAWIGLYNSGSGNDPVWVWENGEESDYINWMEGQPSSSYENYVGFYGQSGWNDYENGTQTVKAYICEWDYVPLEVAETTIQIDKGDSTTIDVVAKKAGEVDSNPKITYKSSDTGVAKVSSDGKVVAVASGSCKITVKYQGATKKVTVIVNASKVTGVSTASKTKNSIKLSWKAQSGVSGYQVWMYDTDLGEYVKVKNVSKDFNSATISKLKKGTTYKFKIRAYVKSGSKTYYGDYSKVYKVKTK